MLKKFALRWISITTLATLINQTHTMEESINLNTISQQVNDKKAKKYLEELTKKEVTEWVKEINKSTGQAKNREGAYNKIATTHMAIYAVNGPNMEKKLEKKVKKIEKIISDIPSKINYQLITFDSKIFNKKVKIHSSQNQQIQNWQPNQYAIHVSQWLNGIWAGSSKIDLDQLPKGSYIDEFGTNQRPFKNKNGYGIFSNYYIAKKKKKSRKYEIKIQINHKTYTANNTETPYQLYKYLSANPNMSHQDILDFMELDPDSARTKAQGINSYSFSQADQVMFSLLLQKFSYSDSMKNKLLDTGDQLLFEGNTWKDQRFGMVLQKNGSLVGENKLGKMLTQIRAMLKSNPQLTATQTQF